MTQWKSRLIVGCRGKTRFPPCRLVSFDIGEPPDLIEEGEALIRRLALVLENDTDGRLLEAQSLQRPEQSAGIRHRLFIQPGHRHVDARIGVPLNAGIGMKALRQVDRASREDLIPRYAKTCRVSSSIAFSIYLFRDNPIRAAAIAARL